MKNTSLPSVGFDRFIELGWANYGLELAASGYSSKELRAWIDQRVDGKDAARKTTNLLTNLWLKEYPETANILGKALALFPDISLNEHLVLHWGMALANFTLFRDTVAMIGRLARLQGQFRRTEIRDRLMEIYSNQGTVPRSVYRIVQSLQNWGVVQTGQSDIYTAAAVVQIDNPTLLGWLFEAALNHDREKYWALQDVLRLPELFPFEIATDGAKVIREANAFSISREGMNRESVSLRKKI